MRLIDADELKKVIFSKTDSMEDLWDTAGVLNAINNAPTVAEIFKSGSAVAVRPIEERPQGEWEYVQYDANPNIGNWHCSECRHIVSGKYNQKPDYNFCPNCGARMKKGGAE